MPSIIYDFIGNTDKLDKSLDNATKKVGEFDKGVKKAGEQIDKSFDKSETSIEKQIALLKKLNDELDALWKANKDRGPYAPYDPNLSKQIEDARAKRDEAATELKRMQQEEVEGNAQVEQSQSNVIGSLGKWGAALFATGTALAIAKKVIDSSADAADKLQEIIGGASAGVSYFFKTISSGDWSNFLKGMGEAIKAGAEFEKTMSSIQNRRNEALIKESEIDKEIGNLREATYDRDDKNNANALKKQDRIIELTRQKYDARIKLDTDTFNAAVARASAITKLSEDEIKTLLREYSSLEKVIEKGREYNALVKELKWGTDPTGKQKQAAQAQIDMLGEGGAALGEYAKKVSKLTDEERVKISQLWAAMNEGERAFDNESRRAATDRARRWNEMLDNWSKEIEEENKVWEERNDIGKKIAEQEIALNNAIGDGNEEEAKGIAKNITLLKEELRLREAKMNAVLIEAMGRAVAPTKVGTSSITAPTYRAGEIPNTLAGKPVYEAGDYIPGTAMLSEAGKARQKKRDADYDADRLKRLKKELELREQIVNAVLDLAYGLGEVVGLDEEAQRALGGMVDMASQLASGNYVGGIVSALSIVMNTLTEDTYHYSEEIDRINGLIEEQQRLIDLSARKGGTKELVEDQLKILQDQKSYQQWYLSEQQKKMGGVSWRKASKAITETTAALKETDIAIAQVQQDLDDFLSGGITENTIADAIAQGFMEGRTSVDDFASYMNQVLLDAVINIFKANILDSPLMKTYMETAKQYLSDNILTKEEKSRLSQMGKEFSDAMKPTWEGLTNSLDISRGSIVNNGLSAGIKRDITEQTGTELAGLFRRFADDNRATKDYTLSGLNHLVGIERNTSETVTQLQLAVVELKNIVTNTKQSAVGTL